MLSEPPLEACQKACEVDGTSCRFLAWMNFAGQGTARNEREGYRLLHKSCAMGDQIACTKLGNALLAGETVAQDAGRGLALLAAACDARLGAACESLGDAYADGQGVAQDDARAVDLYRRACATGSEEGSEHGGCTKLGRMYRAGRGVRADNCLAHGAFGLACARKEPQGCAEFSEAYLVGTVVEKNAANWLDLNRQSCERNESVGCMHLSMGGSVAGVDIDAKALDALSQRICAKDREDSPACAALRLGQMCSKLGPTMCAAGAYAVLMGNPTNDYVLFELLRRTCEGGDAGVCHFQALLHRDSRGVLHDPARAAEIFRRECEAGDGDGCRNLAEMHESGDGVPKDLARAQALREEGCTKNAAASCVAAGKHSGAGATPADLSRAATFYRRACDELKDANGCHELAMALRKLDPARGASPDVMKARERACELGQPIDCSIVARTLRRDPTAPAKRERASRLFLAGCTSTKVSLPEDCLAYGEMVAFGEAPPIDGKQASWAYAEALRKARAGCNPSTADDCATLGMLYEFGRGVRKDPARAFAAYTRDCDAGRCDNVGYAYAAGVGVARDEPKAIAMFRTSCASRPGEYACANQGFMTLLGLGATSSRPQALALLQAAGPAVVAGLADTCKMGCARDCSILGAIKLARDEKDEAKAKLKRGCTLGDDRACKYRVR
jgi:TPR repeat protein